MSKIEWTDRSDWNPIRGCTRVSEGCRNCYAESIAARFSGPGLPFEGFAERTSSGPRWTGKVALIEDRLTLPLRWRKPARIFVNSAFDLFHESVPDEWRYLVIATMGMTYDTATVDHQNVITARRQRHIYQVLTKRPDIQRGFMTALHDATQAGDILSHPLSVAAQKVSRIAGHPFWMNAPFTVWRWVAEGCQGLWLGVSAEDQERADERVPELLATPAALRFVSIEPMLGPVDLRNVSPADKYEIDALSGYDFDQGLVGPRLNWVICGGESGPNARPMHPDWPRAIRDQCAQAGVAFFMKQMSGARKQDRNRGGPPFGRI